MARPKLWDKWEPAVKCSDGPQPGARALMEWVLDTYPEAEDWGIFSCRTIWNGGPLSVHAEGRAIDVGLKKQGARWGRKLADDLVWKSRQLGVQCVIYRREQWAGDHWDKGWRPYIGEGPDPHDSHLHIELSRWTARTLTRERIEKVMRPPHAEAADRRPTGGGRTVSHLCGRAHRLTVTACATPHTRPAGFGASAGLGHVAVDVAVRAGAGDGAVAGYPGAGGAERWAGRV